MSLGGDVVIITGGGRGLGRTYALNLARQGARIVLNDFDAQVVKQTAEEIRRTGGDVVVDSHSVEEGDRIVQTAMGAYGRIDALVNNAGLLRDKSFAKMTDKNWDDVYRVHLLGTFRCCKAVWGHFIQQKYGRIVNVCSPNGIHGNFGQANYAAMKMGIVGLSQSLAAEGSKHNIFVNTILPTAASRMTADILEKRALDLLKPEYIGGVVSFLCSRKCQSTGKIVEVGGRWIAALRWEETKGVVIPNDEIFTVDGIAKRWDEINDFSKDALYPVSGVESFTRMIDYAEEALATSRSNLRSDEQLEQVKRYVESLKSQETLVKDLPRISAAILLSIDNGKSLWVVRLKEGKFVELSKATEEPRDIDIVVNASDETILNWMSRNISLHRGVMTRKFLIRGNMALAMRLARGLDNLIVLAHTNQSKKTRNPPKQEMGLTAKGTTKATTEATTKATTKATKMETTTKATTATASPVQQVKDFIETINTAPDDIRHMAVKRTNMRIRFRLQEAGVYYADATRFPGTIVEGDETSPVDVTLEMSPATFISLVRKKTPAEVLYMRGKLKVKGSIATALKAKALLEVLAISKL